MSADYELILLTRGQHDGNLEQVLNQFFTRTETDGVLEKLTKTHYPGIYLGESSYLDVTQFLTYLHTLDWENPHCVQVLIRHQDADAGFTVSTLSLPSKGTPMTPPQHAPDCACSLCIMFYGDIPRMLKALNHAEQQYVAEKVFPLPALQIVQEPSTQEEKTP